MKKGREGGREGKINKKTEEKKTEEKRRKYFVSMAMIVGPTLLESLDLEYSVHSLPKAHKDDIRAVFPQLQEAQLKNLLVVSTCQRAREDLVTVGEKVEHEKDRLLRVFTEWALDLCKALEQQQGYWSDYIDPCSGLSMVHRDSQSIYDEVAALSVLRGYKVSNAGCCKVVLHPQWGSFIYPATFFTLAPQKELQQAIDNTA